jgi:hypothetical protein
VLHLEDASAPIRTPVTQMHGATGPRSQRLAGGRQNSASGPCVLNKGCNPDLPLEIDRTAGLAVLSRPGRPACRVPGQQGLRFYLGMHAPATCGMGFRCGAQLQDMLLLLCLSILLMAARQGPMSY